MARSMKDFGQFLKAARERAGVSQLYVAVSLGYGSTHFISKIELGIKPLPLRHVRRLCELLSIHEADLREELIELRRNQIEEAST